MWVDVQKTFDGLYGDSNYFCGTINVKKYLGG